MSKGKIIAALAIVAMLSGCAAFKEIGDALRDDPLESALVLSKTNLDTITSFRAENCTPDPREGLEIACKYVGIIDESYTLAHNYTVEVSKRAREGDYDEIDIAIETLTATRESVKIAMVIDDDPERIQRIYAQSVFVIDLLISRLSEAKP